MLLQRLAAYEPPIIPGFEDAALPPFFQERPMRWGLRITPDGELGSIDLYDLSNPADRRTRFGQTGPVPYMARSSGFAPILGADDIQYVLGWADETSKPDRVANCHAAFVALIRRWSDSAPDDPIAQACALFFEQRHHQQVTKPKNWTSKQGVVLLVGEDGTWVTEEPTLRARWELEVQDSAA